jgi:hypothetical protein
MCARRIVPALPYEVGRPKRREETMTEIGFRVRRLVIALVAFGVALFGLAAAPAYASDAASRHDGGRIEVCKKVLGPGDHLKFKFVIKKKDRKEDSKIIKEFTLKKNECKKVDVKKGKHSVTEYVPKNCKIKMIHIKDDGNKNIRDPKKATVWVDVKKGKTVKVTFFDKCKKDDRKD